MADWSHGLGSCAHHTELADGGWLIGCVCAHLLTRINSLFSCLTHTHRMATRSPPVGPWRPLGPPNHWPEQGPEPPDQGPTDRPDRNRMSAHGFMGITTRADPALLSGSHGLMAPSALTAPLRPSPRALLGAALRALHNPRPPDRTVPPRPSPPSSQDPQHPHRGLRPLHSPCA